MILATAKLEDLTEEEVLRYRDLASSSENSIRVMLSGVPHDGQDAAYAHVTGTRIGDSSIEYLFGMWELGRHSEGPMRTQKHLEIDAKGNLITIALHNAPQPGIASVDTFVTSLSIDAVSIDEFARQEVLVGYTLPSDEKPRQGMPQQIASLVFLDEKKGRILRFVDEAAIPGIHSDGAASVKTPLSNAAPYNFPEEYGDVYITAKQIYTAKGWEPWKLTPFIKKHSEFFESVKGYMGKAILLRNLAGIAVDLLNNEQWQSILEQAKSGSIENIVTIPKRESTQHRGPTGKPGVHIYTEPPNVQPYESVLKHPEAVLPSAEDAAHILGIKMPALTSGTYHRHPWIKEDGTIGALERYIYFRAENTHNKPPGERQSELEACLNKLREYETSHPAARPMHLDNPPPPTQTKRAYSYDPSLVKPLADVMLTEQQIRAGYFGESGVISRFINAHSGLFTASYGITRAPLGKLAESLNSSAMLTEKFFEILLDAATQRKRELDQIKGLIDGVKLGNGDYNLDFAELKERLPTISKLYVDLRKKHPTLFKDGTITLENLVTAVRLRAEDHPADFKIKVAGLGAHLDEIVAFDHYLSSPAPSPAVKPITGAVKPAAPSLEVVAQGPPTAEDDGAAQLPHYITPGSPTAQLYNFLQARYPAKQVGALFGYEGRELDVKLREWEKRQLLVPGEDKKYSGEDVVRRLMQLAKQDLFKSWGYKGEKEDIFRAVNADLLGIRDYKGEKKDGGEPPYRDNRGAALEAYVRQHLPGDDLALRIAAELSRGEIDYNRAGQDLPRQLKAPADNVDKTFDSLVGIGLAVQGNTGYTLNTSVLAPH